MGLLERFEAILHALLAELQAHYGRRLVACAVFGSVGRRTPRFDSDIDLLLVIRDLPRGRFNRVEEFLPVEAQLEPALKGDDPGNLPITLSPVFKTPEEVEAGSPLFLDMVEDARILCDPEGFLSGYLDRLRPGSVSSGRDGSAAAMPGTGSSSRTSSPARSSCCDQREPRSQLSAQGAEAAEGSGGAPLQGQLDQFLCLAHDIGMRLFIPTEEYSAADSERAYEEAAWVVALAGEVIERLAT